MTLILGALCKDGVVIAGDSKTVAYENKNDARYDIKKVHRVNTIAFAIAGTGYFEDATEALKQSIGQWLEFNPKIHLGIIVDEISRKAEKFLLTDKAKLTILMANKDFMYLIQARVNKKGYYVVKRKQGDRAIAGIKDVEMDIYKGTETTKDYAEFFKQTIRHNKGSYVGGRTQVVILKNDTTPLQLT